MNTNECESDEDCEVYFLKPVNEYNIVDKIKEANKELFAADTDTEGGADNEDSDSKQANRKVTFALNLEDYEPEGATEESGKTNSSEDSEAVDDLQLKLLADYKFPVIDEEPSLEEETTEETLVEEPESEEQVSVEETSVSPETPIKSTKMASTNEDEECSTSKPDEIDKDDVLEEICEEIIVMDMESEKTAPQEDTISISHRHLMMKQATFDYEEQDNNSLTNLLPSDCDDEDEPIEDDDDDDDDDNLSIIVASYMPDDEFDNASLTSENDHTERLFSHRKSPKFRRIPFSKRFSFRRKGNSSNSIGASSCTTTIRKHVPPAEVTELKLNYKTCCEYRNSVLDKLPKYTGYLSEYGLSREQLDRRQDKQQVKQRFVLEQTLKANEQDMRKMQDNERAFTTWLKNKMRFPINKTRNMFDVKMGAASCGGNRNRK